LCNPDNVNVYLRSQSFPEEDLPLTEEWYSTKYSVSVLTPDLLGKMKNPNCEIKGKKMGLHPANNMIPKNFDILPPNEEFSNDPVMIKQWEDTDLWYKKDDETNRPKAFVYMKYYTTDCEFGTSLKGKVFALLWINMMKEYLREFLAAC
jgi:secreted Zn-dependent insulinase-like peptidase